MLRKRNGRGFTLIELMIVVSIIGILSSVAIPSFLKFQCKAKQSEAKTMLKAIGTVQLAYNGEFGTYLNLTALTTYGGLDPTGILRTKYYNVTATVLSSSTWSASAQDSKLAISQRAGNDVWTMIQSDRGPINITNRCR